MAELGGGAKPPGGARPLAPAQPPRAAPAPTPAAPQAPPRPAPAIPSALDRRSRRDGRSAPRPSPRERLGDPDLDAAGFGELSILLGAEHLMLLLARRQDGRSRESLIEEVGELLLSHPRPDQVKRILLAMGEVGRIVDVYPLEVLIYCLEHRPFILDGIHFGEVIRNKREIEPQLFEVEAPIRLQIPLAAKLKAMALLGGGFPGYHLYPGAPAEYFIEFGEDGRWPLVVRAEIHGEMVVDRVILQIRDAPGSP